MLTRNAPGAWKFETITVAQVRKLQERSRESLNKRVTEFDSLEDIEAIYRLRCFCEGYLEGLQKDGLMGDGLADLIAMVKSAEVRAKRRISKTAGVRTPYRLPTFKEWNQFGLTAPQIKVPRLSTLPDSYREKLDD
ncbi:hypothetical protein WM40_24815 [Robbsia andropogonis]|uniref:Uncharacterized protein n=1 Tax=Robbsia andropogonis TaxID=28092 RepID=A0A0F5JTL7_9BURK|nr:hypothetical protein [Robbsia andropogonis]KKB61158.1 hypothetical protein WM40_24815 [Robbsia andropogonis]